MTGLPSVAMADDVAPDRPLVLDELGKQLQQLRILRDGGDDAATEKLLDELGARDPVEQEIVVQLSATRPLGHPERFAEAHALALRAIEVLDRNGARAPRLPNLGPLTPIASWIVQQVTRFIVRNHQADVIDAIRNLDARRLAWCSRDDPARPVLIKARLDAERVAQGYKGDPIGVPTFLLGGAVISAVGQLLRLVSEAAVGSRTAAIAAVVAAFVVIAGLSWSILRGAAIARHRIHITVRDPLTALWETYGRAGKPPEDDAQMFAVLAILLTIVGWLVIPIGLALVYAVF